MDTGVIADGLRRHGQDALADDLESRILAALRRRPAASPSSSAASATAA